MLRFPNNRKVVEQIWETYFDIKGSGDYARYTAILAGDLLTGKILTENGLHILLELYIEDEKNQDHGTRPVLDMLPKYSVYTHLKMMRKVCSLMLDPLLLETWVDKINNIFKEKGYIFRLELTTRS